jgi:hypothetical protein
MFKKWEKPISSTRDLFIPAAFFFCWTWIPTSQLKILKKKCISRKHCSVSSTNKDWLAPQAQERDFLIKKPISERKKLFLWRCCRFSAITVRLLGQVKRNLNWDFEWKLRRGRRGVWQKNESERERKQCAGGAPPPREKRGVKKAQQRAGVRWGQSSEKERNKFLFTEFNINKETLAAGGFRGLNSDARKKRKWECSRSNFCEGALFRPRHAQLEIFHHRRVLFPYSKEGRGGLWNKISCASAWWSSLTTRHTLSLSVFLVRASANGAKLPLFEWKNLGNQLEFQRRLAQTSA